MAADETDAEVIASSLDQTERFEAIFDRHAAERSPLSAPPSRRAPRRRADSRDVHARIPRQTAIRHQPGLCAPMAIRHRREPGHDAPAFRTPPRARVSAIRRDTHPTILNHRSRRAPRCERARISAQGGACRPLARSEGSAAASRVGRALARRDHRSALRSSAIGRKRLHRARAKAAERR
jgi:hypothetical protein